MRLYPDSPPLLACRYGFIVAVTKVIEIGRGKLSDSGDGLANFPIRYSAVIFKPFRGEVMDCVVTQVGEARKEEERRAIDRSISGPMDRL